jgi:hypothetical protein
MKPADRVRGSVDGYWVIECERRRLERLALQAERRARKRARIVRVLGLFHLSRPKVERVSGASCLVDATRQP